MVNTRIRIKFNNDLTFKDISNKPLSNENVEKDQRGDTGPLSHNRKNKCNFPSKNIKDGLKIRNKVGKIFTQSESFSTTETVGVSTAKMNSDSIDCLSNKWQEVKSKTNKKCQKNSHIERITKTNEGQNLPEHLNRERFKSHQRRTAYFKEINSQTCLFSASNQKAVPMASSKNNYRNQNIRYKNSKKHLENIDKSANKELDMCDKKSVYRNKTPNTNFDKELNSINMNEIKRNETEDMKLHTDVPVKCFGVNTNSEIKNMGAIPKSSPYTQTCEDTDKTGSFVEPEKFGNMINELSIETNEYGVKQMEALKSNQNIKQSNMASNKIWEDWLSGAIKGCKLNDNLKTDLENSENYSQISESILNLEEVYQKAEVNKTVAYLDDNVRQQYCSSTLTKVLETTGTHRENVDFISMLDSVNEPKSDISYSHEEIVRKNEENSDLKIGSNAGYQHNAHVSHLYKDRTTYGETANDTSTAANKNQNLAPRSYFCFPYWLTWSPPLPYYTGNSVLDNMDDSIRQQNCSSTFTNIMETTGRNKGNVDFISILDGVREAKPYISYSHAVEENVENCNLRTGINAGYHHNADISHLSKERTTYGNEEIANDALTAVNNNQNRSPQSRFNFPFWLTWSPLLPHTGNLKLDNMDDSISQQNCSSTLTNIMETTGRHKGNDDFISMLGGVREPKPYISSSHDMVKTVENSDLKTGTNTGYQHTAHISHVHKDRTTYENVEMANDTLTAVNKNQNCSPRAKSSFPFWLTWNPILPYYNRNSMFQQQSEAYTPSEMPNENFHKQETALDGRYRSMFQNANNYNQTRCYTTPSAIAEDPANGTNSNQMYFNRFTYPNVEKNCVQYEPFILEFTYKGEAYYQQIDLSSIHYLCDHCQFNE